MGAGQVKMTSTAKEGIDEGWWEQMLCFNRQWEKVFHKILTVGLRALTPKSWSMRITGGRARGIPLVLPKGDAVRPATDALRQAVFSSLASRVEGVRFLDLFAGSGAYGLEALSRGAAGGVFVEKDARTVEFIHRNVAAVSKSLGRSAGDLRVITADATSTIPAEGVDLVFIDPPYEIIGEVAPKLFARLDELLAANPDPLIVFEMPGGIDLSPTAWTCIKRLGKGVRQPTAAIFRANRALP
jgi:16S rRNA (guanine966-N2)-methyltransferase